MRLRGREVRDRLSRILGLARPFRCQPPRPGLRLRDVRGYVAQAISRLAGIRTHHAVRRTEDARKKKLLRPMRDAPILRTRERAKVGKHSPRIVFGTHGVIDVLRHGIKDGPHHIDLFYGTPSPGTAKAKTL